MAACTAPPPCAPAALPQVVRLRPLAEPPVLPQEPADVAAAVSRDLELQQKRTEAAVQKDRATRARAAAEAAPSAPAIVAADPAQAPPQPAAGPTAEERQARAEHFRRQR